MTNWVTIKIPETTRDKAKNDSRTYEEIMKAGLESDNNNAYDNTDAQDIANEVVNQIDVAAFNGGISDEKADEVIGKLEDMRSQMPVEVAQEVNKKR
jgi:hypothetical protein